ncbi:MAG: MFS transporter [Gammaproteobacteria bacterium]|nr:MFS transporter [Gammaproteobacteria bacterium]
MTGYLAPVASLLISVAILLTGHGLQLTLLPLRAEILGFSPADIGFTGSSYFLGFVIGCLTIPRIIAGVGHIRTFSVMAAIATAGLLLLSLSETLTAWIALRFSTGWALCGLYMVIESWLNERAPTEIRGGILSLYAMITLLAISGAQLFLGYDDPSSSTLFIIAALLLSLAIVPIGLTRTIAPHPVARVRFDPARLFNTSQVAVVTAALGGMVTGGFWALGPVYASAQGLSAEDVGLFMIAAILGGAALQYPVGRLSDHYDRRRVIFALTALGAVAAVLTGLYGHGEAALIFAFAFGATSMPLYALCVAHANDNITDGSFVEMASGILMMNSIGSVAGPAVAAGLMGWFGPAAMFYFAAFGLAAASLWTLHRLRAHRTSRGHVRPFAPLPEMTPAASTWIRGATRWSTVGAGLPANLPTIRGKPAPTAGSVFSLTTTLVFIVTPARAAQPLEGKFGGGTQAGNSR